MSRDEAADLAQYCNSLFGDKMNEAQSAWLVSMLVNCESNAARAAIDAHRESQKFLRLEVLSKQLKGNRQASPSADPNQRPRLTWHEFQRRRWAQIAGKGDVEVTLRVYRALWHDPHCTQSDGYRSQFGTECKTQLVGLGIPPERATALMLTIFEPPTHFRSVLEEVRDMYPDSRVFEGDKEPEEVGAVP